MTIATARVRTLEWFRFIFLILLMTLGIGLCFLNDPPYTTMFGGMVILTMLLMGGVYVKEGLITWTAEDWLSTSSLVILFLFMGFSGWYFLTTTTGVLPAMGAVIGAILAIIVRFFSWIGPLLEDLSLLS